MMQGYEDDNDIEKQNFKNNPTFMSTSINNSTFTSTSMDNYPEINDSETKTNKNKLKIYQLKIFKKKINIMLGRFWYICIPLQSLIILVDYIVYQQFKDFFTTQQIFFNFAILIILILSYTILVLKDPGIVNKKKIRFNDDSQITCMKCYTTEKDQAQHCHMCGVCIKNLHHHCVWISKCQGQGNRWFFYAFFLSGTIFYLYVFLYLLMFNILIKKLTK